MKTKTKAIIFRVSEDEHREIVKRSQPFLSITNYIKSALKEFSNKTHRQKIEASKEFIELYRDANMHLAHLGGNLNQIVHRINEQAKAGFDVSPIIISEILPQLQSLQSECTRLKGELLRVTNKYRI